MDASTTTAGPGRPRDPSRDAAILDAALEVMGEVGYAGMTMDAVASRAGAGKATLYRRWDSKQQLALAAVHHLGGGAVDLDALPDTGELRGDLLALFRAEPGAAAERRLQVVLGLASLLMVDDELADAVADALSVPWSQAHLALMRRAAQRGEIADGPHLATLSRVVASMAAFRSLVERRAFDRAYLETLLDTVVIPALRGAGAPPTR